MSGTSELGGSGGINFLEAVIERLNGCLNAVIDSLWDVVAALDCLETATQRIVLDGRAVWAKLVGLLGVIQKQLEDLLAAAKEATGAIVRLVGFVEVARENV